MKTLLRPAISLFILLSLITGFAYPLLVTGIGKAVFPDQAAGSLIIQHGKPVGSTLIGQNFSGPKYFWGRLSATGRYPYNAGASSGSNLGPLNPALIDAVKGRIDALKAADPNNMLPIPADLVTASGSGLDPHISPAAADYQLLRIATARSIPAERLKALVAANTEGRQWGAFGEPRVNVLGLNLALDALVAK
ncbi:MAG: potassium-transporting ATPase subunit KdpC [Gammaproteobacteria bacterium]|nr:potassium-transporting ATPase subunit KdpC [Gammaproteobacteria bacterium]